MGRLTTKQLQRREHLRAGLATAETWQDTSPGSDLLLLDHPFCGQMAPCPAVSLRFLLRFV